jgi:hypothetical protein
MGLTEFMEAMYNARNSFHISSITMKGRVSFSGPPERARHRVEAGLGTVSAEMHPGVHGLKNEVGLCVCLR